MRTRLCIDRPTTKKSVIIAAVIAAAPVNAAVFCQEAKPYAEAIIGFEGGLVGDDSAKVIKQFSEINGNFATRTYLPKDTVDLCGILKQELLIPAEFCTKNLLSEVKALNQRNGIEIDPDAINPKTGVILPLVKAETRFVERYFDTSDELQEQRVKDIDKNWQSLIKERKSDVLNSQSVNSNGDERPIELRIIKKLEWTLPLKTEDDYFGAILARKELSGQVQNLSVGIEQAAPQPKAAYSPPNIVYERWCEAHAAAPGEGSYDEMAARFYETKTVVECELENGQPVTAEIAIVDQPIATNPDLAESLGAVAPLPPSQCIPGAFDKSSAHGTLLASIVASSENSYGFKGIAPGAKIVQLTWTRTQGNNKLLYDFLEDNQSIPVVLFASNFNQDPPYRVKFENDVSERQKAAQKAVWKWDSAQGEYLRELADSSVRFELDLAGKVMKQNSLFVVAAGQVDGGGRVIFEQSELAPQNIGELGEVLVVAACDDCTSMLPSLAKDSNRNAIGGRSVSVLAPGGDLPFYVSETQTAKSPVGTSGAAAFAAGLAAKMSACYPSSYKLRPEKLKERIVLTSFPVADSSALAQVSGSVIDISVAMLDPKATWLKTRSDMPPRKVTVDHWCANEPEITDENDNPTFIQLQQTRRLSMVENHIVQRIIEKGPKTSIERPKFVKRIGPGPLKNPEVSLASVEEADGTPCLLRADNLRDLIVSKTTDAVGVCGDELPLCN
jgi:hypothetical protein